MTWKKEEEKPQKIVRKHDLCMGSDLPSAGNLGDSDTSEPIAAGPVAALAAEKGERMIRFPQRTIQGPRP